MLMETLTAGTALIAGCGVPSATQLGGMVQGDFNYMLYYISPK